MVTSRPETWIKFTFFYCLIRVSKKKITKIYALKVDLQFETRAKLLPSKL